MKEKNQKSFNAFLDRSKTYLTLKAEKEEIDRHKWIESEKAGYDIGFDRAMFEWIRYYKKDCHHRKVSH